MAEKSKLQLEYLINCSPKVLYNRLSTASGLSEWFADDVRVKGNIFTFVWENTGQVAEKKNHKENKMVRYEWVENDDKNENYSSVAITDCQVFLIEKEAIAKVIKNNGVFGFDIIKRYCGQNVNLFDSLHKVLYKQMNGRIAETLLYLDSLKGENPEIFQLLSRKDIADFAGISTESAVKLLKSFEKDGLILLNDKDIVVVNHKEMQEISKRG